jgi:hypothetical protein
MLIYKEKQVKQRQQIVSYFAHNINLLQTRSYSKYFVPFMQLLHVTY